MYITRRNLEALQEIVMTQTREQLARLRSAIPDDKDPFDFEKFLNLSYGDDFGKTPEKLELSHYT